MATKIFQFELTWEQQQFRLLGDTVSDAESIAAGKDCIYAESNYSSESLRILANILKVCKVMELRPYRVTR